MTKRIVLYGYSIENGYYVPDQAAADTVRRIFELYCMGESYSRIADLLNSDQTIYLEERPLWNKHIIKRILGNSKYCGDKIYPAIITKTQFQTVQELIADKTSGQIKKEKNADAELWQYLTCGHCSGTMHRTGGGSKDKSQVCLRCKACGTSLRVEKKRLFDEVLQQYNTFQIQDGKSYEPSDEVIRLTNTLNRSLERCDEPKQIIDIILQGISARYNCCSASSIYQPIQNLKEIDWKVFKQSVKAIHVTEDNIVLAFKKRLGGVENGRRNQAAKNQNNSSQQTSCGKQDDQRPKNARSGLLSGQHCF